MLCIKSLIITLCHVRRLQIALFKTTSTKRKHYVWQGLKQMTRQTYAGFSLDSLIILTCSSRDLVGRFLFFFVLHFVHCPRNISLHVGPVLVLFSLVTNRDSWLPCEVYPTNFHVFPRRARCTTNLIKAIYKWLHLPLLGPNN